MKLTPSIELFDLSLYTNNTLVMTDFHVGYEEALNKQGVFVPRFQFKEILKRLDKVFDQLKRKQIDTIVIAGDLKHEFGSISDQEWRHTLQLIDYFSKKCKHIVLLKGNHDKILGPIVNKRNVSFAHYFLIDGNEQYIFDVDESKKKTKNKKQKQLTIMKKTLLHTSKNEDDKETSKKESNKKKLLKEN